MEEMLVLLALFAIAVIAILPIWALVMLYGIRRHQENQREQALAEHRRLVQRLDSLDMAVGRIGSRMQSSPTSVEKKSSSETKDLVTSTAMPVLAPQVVITAPAATPLIKPAPSLEIPTKSTTSIKPAEVLTKTATVLGRYTASEPVKSRATSETETAPGAMELAARQIIQRIWNWIIVGEEHRKPGASMEQAVATTWLMRVSILLVVVGIGFGLKYSIDKGYLGPAGRVAMSLVCGAAMVVGGLPLLNKRYHIAGQGLIGGGLAALYFGLFAGFSLWHLFGAIPAFALMALVTVSAGVIAVRFNSLLIAILGILGGYGTPVMLSTGVENFSGLFSYMLLLGFGVLGIAWRRQWHLLNILAMMCTYVLYFGAVHQPEHYTDEKFLNVFPFLITFFVLFSTMMFAYNLRRRVTASLIEIIALLVNASVVFGGGFELIKPRFGQEWVAALTLGLSLFYIGHVYIFLARRLRDKALLFCFLGLAAFFLTVTVPMALSGAWITTSWAVLALVMYWMGLRLESRFLQKLAGIVCVLVLGRFCLDMHAAFGYGLPEKASGGYLVMLAERLVQFGVPIACFGAAWWLSRKHASPFTLTVAPENDLPSTTGHAWIGRSGMAIMGIMLFIYLQFEFFRLFSLFYQPMCLPSLTLVWVGACAVLLTLFARVPSSARRSLLMLVCLATVVKLVFVDLMDWEPSTCGYRGDYVADLTLVRLFDFGLVFVFFAFAFRVLARRPGQDNRATGVMLGVTSLGLLFLYLTCEVNTALQYYQPTLRPGGVSLLWAGYALSLIFAGIIRNIGAMRYTGLMMFVVVATKLFFFDLEHMEIIFRVMVLILIGVAMFAGSVFYQKYRERLDDGCSSPTDSKKGNT
ncbi:MAG: DUF2339 domain-containing protein [Planctomycetota bacterium]